MIAIRKKTSFAAACKLYLSLGGEARYLPPLLNEIGKMPCNKINQMVLMELQVKLFPNLSPATINRKLFTPIIAVLNYAARSGLCQPPVLQRPKIVTRPVSLPPPGWHQKVITHASPKLAALIVFLMGNGCRISEAINMKLGDVDFEKCCGVVWQGKTQQSRMVFLTKDLVARLKALPHLRGADLDTRLFGWQQHYSVYKPLRRACEKAGVAYFAPHIFGRHAFASGLLAAGHSLKMIAEAGGWKSHRLVATTYGHLEQSGIENAVRRFQENINN